MSGIIQQRASSMPRFIQCVSSAIPCEHPYNPSSDASDLGTATHEPLAIMAEGGEPDLNETVAKHDVDIRELSMLYAFGKQAWGQIGKYFPNARTEVRLESPLVRGKSDVLYHDTETCAIADWKSGRVRSNSLYQLGGYAYATRHVYGMPSSGKITTIAVWLRDGEIETKHWTDDDLNEFERTIIEAQKQIGKQYAPGEACTFCQRQLVCKARAEYLRSASTALAEVNLKKVTLDVLAQLYPRAKALEKALKAYDTALHSLLENASEPASTGDGRFLELVDIERDKIDPNKAFKIITENYDISRDEYTPLVTIGKTKLMDLIKSKAARGYKGKVAAAALDELREAGAVTTTMNRQIKITKEN